MFDQTVKNFKVFEGVIENNAYHTQISGEGFGDMKEEDVEEVLTEKAVEPTNEDVDKMVKQGIRFIDESQL